MVTVRAQRGSVLLAECTVKVHSDGALARVAHVVGVPSLTKRL